MKGSSEQVITLAWQIENFGRAGKAFKGLDHYLKPPLSPEQRRAKGAEEVRRMFERRIKQQEGRNGTE